MGRCYACCQENCGYSQCSCPCHNENDHTKIKPTMVSKAPTMKLAALVDKSITIPGDERSRTHPGHGYPEHTQSYTELVEFKNHEAMEKWIKDYTSRYSPASFRLIKYEVLEFETEIKVKVKGL